MFYLNLMIDKTEIEVYFTDNAFANQQAPLTEEEQATLLKKIALKCCEALFTDENKLSHYKKSSKIELMINNVLLPEQNDHTTAVIQCSYALRAGVYSHPTILTLDLNGQPTFNYKVDTQAPLSFYDIATEDLLNEQSKTGEKEWVAQPEVKKQQQTVLTATSNVPVNRETSPRVDILQAPDQKEDEVIKALCTRADLTEEQRSIAAHLLPDQNLQKELLPFVQSTDNQGLFLYWVNRRIPNPDEKADSRLLDYVLRQKGLALQAINERKENAIKALIQQSETEYGNKISESQPIEYLRIYRKLQYIRKNIIIALYNAAQNYYNTIMGPLKKDEISAKDSEKFSAKLLTFNEKFQGIAQIDANTLQLSPLEDAFKSLTEYPRLRTRNNEMSLEQAVDLLLQRCAHVGSNNDITDTSFAQAFKSAEESLNKFNDSEHPDPGADKDDQHPQLGKLFTAINAPLANSTLGSALRYFTFGRRIVDVTAKLTGFTNKLFRFEPTIARLDDDLAEAEGYFRKKLAKTKQWMDELHEKTQTIIQQEDKEFAEIYTKAETNILAFKDLLAKSASISNRIETINLAIRNQNAALKPFLDAVASLTVLSEKYQINRNDLDQFVQTAFDKDTYKQLMLQNSNLQNLAASIPTTEVLDEMITHSHSLDSMLIPGKRQYPHKQPIKKLKDVLRECKRQHTNITDSVLLHQDNITKGINRIQSFHQCDAAITAIETTKAQIKARDFTTVLSLGQFGERPIPMAQENLREAQGIIARLEDELDAREKEFSVDNPHDEILMAAIQSKSNATIQEGQQALNEYKNNLYDLLLCNMIVNAVRNFEHWEKVANFLDAKVTINEQQGLDIQTYQIPASIYALSKLADDNRFANWETNPQAARDLLTAIHTHTATSRGSLEIKAFCTKLHGMIALDTPHDLNELDQNLQRLNQTSKMGAVTTPVTVKSQSMRIIQYQQTFFEKNPNFKRAIIGGLIAIAALAVVAAICTACAFTGGAPLIVAGAASVMAIGGAGFAAGLLSAATIVSSAIGMVIGFFGSKAWEQRKASRAQRQENNNGPDDLFSNPHREIFGAPSSPARRAISVSFKPFFTDRLSSNNIPAGTGQPSNTIRKKL